MGHTFPGAAAPFGLVQLSPETDTIQYSYDGTYNPAVYRYCAGYQYNDSTIVGFSHTHFSGTGHSDLGDVLIMPTDRPPPPQSRHGGRARERLPLALLPRSRGGPSPGYYAVTLDDYRIRASSPPPSASGSTATRLPSGRPPTHTSSSISSAGIYNYDGKVVWSSVRVESDTLVTGFRQTSGWAPGPARLLRDRASRARSRRTASGTRRSSSTAASGGDGTRTTSFPERAGRAVKGALRLQRAPGRADPRQGGPLGRERGGTPSRTCAPRSPAGTSTRRGARRARSGTPSSRGSPSRRTATASSISTRPSTTASLRPAVFSDVNGEYRGARRERPPRRRASRTTPSSRSGTPTARSIRCSPILQRKRTTTSSRRCSRTTTQSVHRILPVWSHWANETWCMIGYHAVPVIADAYLKGIRGFDADKAFEAMVASATLRAVRRARRLPEPRLRARGRRAERGLEDARVRLRRLDDRPLRERAGRTRRRRPSSRSARRATRNLFDPATGFMRARNSDGSWQAPFDPLAHVGARLHRGERLELLPLRAARRRGAHGAARRRRAPRRAARHALRNADARRELRPHRGHHEGRHHRRLRRTATSRAITSPYLYCYAGQPWQTQERIRQIVDAMYRNAPDGLGGNDDCGQMSAWYVFACLGFYPVCPGSNEYVVGSPCVDRASIRLENGKTFSIEARNLSAENVYVQSASLNGRPHNACFIAHEAIMKGGRLVFEMGPKPNTSWGTGPGAAPRSRNVSGGRRSGRRARRGARGSSPSRYSPPPSGARSRPRRRASAAIGEQLRRIASAISAPVRRLEIIAPRLEPHAGDADGRAHDGRPHRGGLHHADAHAPAEPERKHHHRASRRDTAGCPRPRRRTRRPARPRRAGSHPRRARRPRGAPPDSLDRTSGKNLAREDIEGRRG